MLRSPADGDFAVSSETRGSECWKPGCVIGAFSRSCREEHREAGQVYGTVTGRRAVKGNHVQDGFYLLPRLDVLHVADGDQASAETYAPVRLTIDRDQDRINSLTALAPLKNAHPRLGS